MINKIALILMSLLLLALAPDLSAEEAGLIGQISHIQGEGLLRYVPEDEELGAESESAMTVEDSVEKVKWFEEREADLKARETAVEKRARELDVLEKKVNQKILRLEQAESSRVTQLARLYDGMDARAVARLAANLDDNTMVSILPRMKPKNASAVLALMPAKRAAKLSKQLITIAEN